MQPIFILSSKSDRSDVCCVTKDRQTKGLRVLDESLDAEFSKAWGTRRVSVPPWFALFSIIASDIGFQMWSAPQKEASMP